MKKSLGLKAISVLLVFIFTIGIFSGCGNTEKDRSAESTAQETTTASQPNNKYPLTLTDAGGTAVTINSKPVKIASMPLGTCEMLLSLVDKSTIAAMTHYVDDENVSNVADAAKGVGQRLDSNAEKLIALQPDLIFVDSWTKNELIQQLRDAKITVFVLNVPSNVDQEKEMLRLLGNITDSDTNAEKVISWMDEKLKAISDKLANLTEDKKLTILDYSEMSSTSGKGTNFDDVVTRAGLINPVSKDGLEGWPQLSKEMVVKYNPDIICLPSWYYDANVNYETLSKSIKDDKALADIKAVKNNKLITVPYNHLTTTSQYSVLAIEDMARAAYPELFK